VANVGERWTRELQNRWSASLAMSTDGSFPSRPRQFLYSTRTRSSSDQVGLVDYGSGLAAADTDEDALVQPVEIGAGGLDPG
jgi:hypothetical protein